MTNYPNNNDPSTYCCFSGFFKKFICTGNLPTHPSPLDNNKCNSSQLEKPTKFNSSLTNNYEENLNLVKSQVQTQAHNSPGIIAKLMGLETLPISNDKKNSTTLDSLFRSKSLNSLYFLPDFDPARASFHRRARTSASFHEQGHKLLFKIDENLESEGVLFVQESNVGSNEFTRKKKKEGELMEKNRKICGKSRVKVGEGKKKFEECYTNGSSFNRGSRSLKKKLNESVRNAKVKERLLVDYRESKVMSSRIIVSKKKIGKNNQVLCINNEDHGKDSRLNSRSLVSVLDHHKEVYKVNRRNTSSSSRRISTTNIKIHNKLAQDIAPKPKKFCDNIVREDEVVKTGRKVADNLVEILGHICMLAEEHTLRETNWLAHYNSFDVDFVEELSLKLGQQMLDLLLDELLHDITIML